jgi:hypothetical protein
VNFTHHWNRKLVAYFESQNRPVLVHPVTGVVFGYAGGSLTYALRLPAAERAEASAAGARTIHDYPAYLELGVAASSLDLADFGPERVFGRWLKEEERWCRAAFDAAGSADSFHR